LQFYGLLGLMCNRMGSAQTLQKAYENRLGRVEDALGDENHIERFGSPLRLTRQAARCAPNAQTQFSSDLAFRHAKLEYRCDRI
jgi:hypothetical protein